MKRKFSDCTTIPSTSTKMYNYFPLRHLNTRKTTTYDVDHRNSHYFKDL